MRAYILLVPRNSSRGGGVIPSLAELGEQFYQLTSAWVLPVWNVASWSVVRCIVRCVVSVALNVTTASVQLRVLHNSVYLPARLKLRGNYYTCGSVRSCTILYCPVRTFGLLASHHF
jgi:hypothetical protein